MKTYPDFELRTALVQEKDGQIWFHMQYLTELRFKYRGIWYKNSFIRYAKTLETDELSKLKEQEKFLKQMLKDVYAFQVLQKYNKGTLKLLGIEPDFDQQTEEERLVWRK